MNKKDYEDYLRSIRDMLQNKVADYLDVNRQHIRITFVDTDAIYENMWKELEEGEPDWFETYYPFCYQFRESINNGDYGEETNMVWQHTYTNDALFNNESYQDVVMTDEEFDNLFNSHKSGEPMQYVSKPKPLAFVISGNNIKS